MHWFTQNKSHVILFSLIRLHRGGLETGDIIVKLNGHSLVNTGELLEAVQEDIPLLLEVRRGNDDLLFNIEPISSWSDNVRDGEPEEWSEGQAQVKQTAREFLQMNDVRVPHVIASGFQRTNGGKKSNCLPNYFWPFKKNSLVNWMFPSRLSWTDWKISNNLEK